MKQTFVLSILSGIALLTTASAAPSSRNPFSSRQIKHFVTFGDSYSVQNVGGGRVQWLDWAAGYADVGLSGFAQSGATCSQALTPRIYPGVLEDELPLYLSLQKNGTLQLKPRETLYVIWIGTNDVGAGCLLTGDQTPGVTIVDTSACVTEWAKTLYKSGARNFLFMNMVPLHRSPMYALNSYPTRYWLAAKNSTAFHYTMEQLVRSGNALTNFMIKDLVKEYPAANFGIFDSYGLFSDMTDQPQLYFNGTAPFNTTGSANPCIYPVDGAGEPTCSLVSDTDVDSYLWFNELHVTNQANRVVARQVADVIRGRENKWTTWL
ncbi:hypothetical protein AX16_002946 [Volvariella volvacea WC 439]|nr:hypothetical protein AX16_002946 [Volvariella volvacea WC 439]